VEGLTSEEGIRQVPFLTKSHQRSVWDEFTPSEEAQKKLRTLTSSGSSGAPIRLFFDPIAELPRRFQELRFLSAHGWKPWHKQVICEHHDHSLPPRFLVQKMGIWRRDPLPWWLGPERAVRFINESKPNIVHGMLSNLQLLALAAESAGGFAHQVDFVASKGELLDPATRSRIEEIFGAPMVDYYATEETGIIAWECPSGEGYHVDEDLVYVEVVKENGEAAGPGELGEIVVTNLYMRAMPIIRYRTGDIGALTNKPCSCGRGLPLLTQLHGRTIHLIVTPSGTVFHPGKIMEILEHAPGVDHYRVIQEAEDRLSIKVNWKASFGDDEKRSSTEALRGAFETLLGAELQVEVEEVPPLEVLYGAKNPLVRGLPENDFQRLTAKGQALKINL